ncbi:hypothetical protein RSAG8_12034, partial [Rhizoctonia solani AG-8 WAC10335]
MRFSAAQIATLASALFGVAQASSPLTSRATASVVTKCTENNTVAITFDDGPYNWTMELVDLLDSYGAKGTFFVNGNNCKDSIGATAKQSKSHYGNILDQRPGHILTLNHETIETTAHDVIPDALKKIKDKKYKMVTVAQCLGMEPYQAITSPSSRDGSWAC